MRKVTRYQKDYLLTFFKNDECAGWRNKSEMLGWRNIAEMLLEKGSCIVAGTNLIWRGGLGNFMVVTEAKDAVDCLLLKFDLEYFLNSAFYKDAHKNYVENLETVAKDIAQQWEEIRDLV